MNQPHEIRAAGLCATCLHMRLIRSDRGSVFYLCGLAATDPRFKKYPALPVMACSGYLSMPHSVEFFETQFQRQAKAGEFALNPFERLALDYIQGTVLDLGCGLGNLALEAARRGCTVTAIDASPTAIARIRSTAREERLSIEAVEANLADFQVPSDYDTIVAIGLLMFFREARALAMLRDIQNRVRPGGRAIINVLIEGTTYMDMFTPGEYHLFRHEELIDLFAGWVVGVARHDDFPAAGNTVKVFATLIARKP